MQCQNESNGSEGAECCEQYAAAAVQHERKGRHAREGEKARRRGKVATLDEATALKATGRAAAHSRLPTWGRVASRMATDSCSFRTGLLQAGKR